VDLSSKEGRLDGAGQRRDSAEGPGWGASLRRG